LSRTAQCEIAASISFCGAHFSPVISQCNSYTDFPAASRRVIGHNRYDANSPQLRAVDEIMCRGESTTSSGNIPQQRDPVKAKSSIAKFFFTAF
jgi:hypothetical protein